ncbi:hypothetical protein HN748_06280 [Candidatus Peregrinibacteria bacterium]|jgi:hypothetical protein|nr:hypothetical protein [Candidatus Peregrinibacteria bacterium]MBT7484367.1 hypothetical protein [Candidatus Peregrinibacteria bacterium]MBT7703810.1 hypothetical protein [Candidatus Peregrinibacteria bacterium]
MVSKIEQAKDDLQQVADNAYSDAVELGLESDALVNVTMDDDRGFSFMAKRAYQASSFGYSSRKALKAAMLLSIKFIDATGDSRLRVYPGDSLSINHNEAILTRREETGDVSYTVQFEEEEALQSHFEAEKELVQAETHQAREVVRSNNQMPFVLGSSDNIRRTLGIGEEMLVTSTHMGLQVDQYPGYAFGDLNFGGTNTTEWLIGYAPHLRQNQFIVIGKKNHKKIGSANNKAGLESLLRAKISENNEEESLLAIIEDAPPSDDQGIAIAEEDLDQDGVADLTIEDATRPIQPAPQNIRVQATDSHSGKSLGSVSRIDQQRGFSSTNQIDALPQSSQNPVNSVINSVFVEYSQRHGAPPIVARSDTYFTDRYMISLRDPLYVEISRGGQTPRYKVYYRRTVYNPYERAQEIVSENVLTGGRDGWTTSLKEVDRLVRQEVLHA